jgi:hypothetical protein
MPRNIVPIQNLIDPVHNIELLKTIITSTTSVIASFSSYYLYKYFIEFFTKDSSKTLETKDPSEGLAFRIKFRKLLEQIHKNETNPNDSNLDKFIVDNFKEIENYKENFIDNLKKIIFANSNPFQNHETKKFIEKLAKEGKGIENSLKQILEIIDEKKIANDFIESNLFSGNFIASLIYNKNFKLLHKFLQNLDPQKIDEEKISDILEAKDNYLFNADLLTSASIMSCVASQDFLSKVEELYTKFPPKQINLHFFMLDSKHFSRIFESVIYSVLKNDDNAMINHLIKVLNHENDNIKDFINDAFRKTNLIGSLKYTESGYEDSILSQSTNDLKIRYEALKSGSGIIIYQDEYFKLNAMMSKDEETFDKFEDRIIISKNLQKGIFACASQSEKSIADVAKENIRQNVKIFIEISQKILEERKKNEVPLTKIEKYSSTQARYVSPSGL